MYKEIICPKCCQNLTNKIKYLSCPHCGIHYQIQNNTAFIWKEHDEKDNTFKKRLAHEVLVDKKLLDRKLVGDQEFWQRFERSTYAAYMMDQKPYRTLEKMLPDLSSYKILDIGCGGGNEAEWLLNLGAKVVCVDISLDMIKLAQKRFSNHDCKPLYYVLANAEFLPFAPDSFDLVIFGTALHHIPRYKLALNCASKIAPIIAAVNEPADMGFLLPILDKTGWNAEYGNLKTHRFNPNDLKKVIAKVGFNADIKTDFTWFPLRLFQKFNNSRLFVDTYYTILKIPDFLFPSLGHNMTLVARRRNSI